MADETPQIPPELSERLARIEAHLSRWKDYQSLWPPLPESKVRELEATRFGLVLPEDYRAYITTVADGGPGPLSGFEAAMKSAGILLKPCMLHPDEEYWAQWDEATKSRERDNGILPLFVSEYGEMLGLVVTGSAKGRVLTSNGYAYRYPLFADETSFVDFYLRWLDDRYNRRPFVSGNFETTPGVDLMFRRCSEEELLAGATMQSTEPVSVRALLLLERAGPSERSIPLVHEAMADPRPRVRAATVPILERLKADSELIALLNDKDADVRKVTVYAIRNLLEYRSEDEVSPMRAIINRRVAALKARFIKNKPEAADVAEDPAFSRFDEALTARIQVESDAGVYSMIARTLKFRGKLTPELVLAPTVAYPELRDYAAYYLKRVDMPRDLSLAVSLLHDSDIGARNNAITAFNIWGKPAIAAIEAALKQEVDPERKALLEIGLKRARHWWYIP
jgi:hypothetical protein